MGVFDSFFDDIHRIRMNTEKDSYNEVPFTRRTSDTCPRCSHVWFIGDRHGCDCSHCPAKDPHLKVKINTGCGRIRELEQEIERKDEALRKIASDAVRYAKERDRGDGNWWDIEML